MKDIFISSIRDESKHIFQLAEQYNLGIEVLGFIEQYQLENYDMSLEATRTRLLNISKRSLHGPFMDLFPGSFDPAIVNVVKHRFLSAYRTARDIQAQHIIFHAGYIPKATFPKTWLNNCVVFWNNFLLDMDENIEIHIENVCEDDYGLMRELIEAIDNPRLSICLDIGHANIHSLQSLDDWIKGLGDKIKYVHLHNNDGVKDCHWGLCRGEIEILSILELLESYSPNAHWSLETKIDETEESISLLCRHGFIK